MGQTCVILASGSPRRRDLLATLGIAFEVVPAGVDETPGPGEPPGRYVARLAEEKAREVAARRPGALVLAADTSVILAGEILGKPSSAAHARSMLSSLSGRAHEVLTGVALAGAHRAVRVVSTQVRFRAIGPGEIAWYVETGEPMDKAGAYAIQGIGGFLIEAIEGSPSNVVGLPVAETLALLKEGGLQLPWEQQR